MDRHTDRPTDRHTDRQTDEQTCVPGLLVAMVKLNELCPAFHESGREYSPRTRKNTRLLFNKERQQVHVHVCY